jgi:hypothetical protein
MSRCPDAFATQHAFQNTYSQRALFTYMDSGPCHRFGYRGYTHKFLVSPAEVSRSRHLRESASKWRSAFVGASSSVDGARQGGMFTLVSFLSFDNPETDTHAREPGC